MHLKIYIFVVFYSAFLGRKVFKLSFLACLVNASSTFKKYLKRRESLPLCSSSSFIFFT